MLSSSNVSRINFALRLKTRQLSTSTALMGNEYGNDPVKNFNNFHWPNEVGSFEHHKLPQSLLDYEYNYPVCRDTMGIRWPGYWFKRKFVYVQEMEPELVVPDLTDFKLKPYVSYRARDVDNSPFTAKELFDAVYKEKITNECNLDAEYTVSREEINQARLAAVQTGADLFEDPTYDGVRSEN